ncbi:MAG: hypothetical protein ACREPS_11180, partial [Rhodanobacteraceae bacterium]
MSLSCWLVIDHCGRLEAAGRDGPFRVDFDTTSVSQRRSLDRHFAFGLAAVGLQLSARLAGDDGHPGCGTCSARLAGCVQSAGDSYIST